MATFAPWLTPPNFQEALESGARLGLSRQQMLQEAAEHAAQLNLEASRLSQEGGEENANRAERQTNEQAANALRTAALQQSGLLGEQKNANTAAALEQRGGALDAREALDQARAEALERQKPIFSNTGGGLMQFDQSTGKWTLVPGSSKAPAAAKTQNMGTVKVPLDGSDETKGTIDVPINSPAYKAWSQLKPTVTPGAPVTHWFGADTPGQDVTNAPPSLGEFMRSPAAAGLNAPAGNSLLNVPAAAPTGSSQPNIPQYHIDYLNAHPETAGDFAKQYNVDPNQYLTNAPAAPSASDVDDSQ